MKTDIHPEYVLANVHCSCGNQLYTRSTKSDLHVEICSACHPFYTGKQKLVDTGGRVERFRRRGRARRRLRSRPGALRGPALEPLDAAPGIDQLLLAGVEGMALGADLDVEIRLRRARVELVSARAAHVGEDVLGMNSLFHRH